MINKVCGALFYKYNGNCVLKCPDCTESNDDDECIVKSNCYLDTNDNQLKECFHKCKSCNEGGDETNHNCKECIDNYMLLDESNNKKNCYVKCNNYYFFDQSNIYNCTSTPSCPQNYNKFIENKRKCIVKMIINISMNIKINVI